MDHIFHDREDGLAHCKVCNGGEGSLPTECPGRQMTATEADAVYAGQLDFVGGTWASATTLGRSWQVVHDGDSLAMLRHPDGRIFRLQQLGKGDQMWGNADDNDEVCAALAKADEPDTAVVDLDALAWQRIKESVGRSEWVPQGHYMMNDWVSDICRFLEEGPTEFIPYTSERGEAATEYFSSFGPGFDVRTPGTFRCETLFEHMLNAGRPHGFKVGDRVYFDRAHYKWVGVVTEVEKGAVVAKGVECGSETQVAHPTRITYLQSLRVVTDDEEWNRLTDDEPAFQAATQMP